VRLLRYVSTHTLHIKGQEGGSAPEGERFEFPGLDKDGNHSLLRVEQQRPFIWAKGQKNENVDSSIVPIASKYKLFRLHLFQLPI
jgi:hypothetical protein